MGYHAPSAEDVYRYIFRLDRHSRNGLSDGFSWSILFLNDNSPVCREFLTLYGAELCYRTADRIRFVFFSGLEAYEFQGAADAANRRGGFLSRIIQAAARLGTHRRSYDFERDDWDALRPEALYPLDSQERISRQINYQVEMYSAMPGSEEALRLAQRLGIGRFVPCFLLFSDIGAPAAFLFPVAYRTPREVFERLRVWIDSFYEVNHATLTRWTSIESSIEQAVSKYQTSIGKVKKWRDERKTQWEALHAVTKYLNQVANGPPDIALLEKIGRDYSIPWEIRNLAAPFLERLRLSKEKQEDARVVGEWLGRVLAADTPQALRAELKFSPRNVARLPEPARALLREALNSLSPPELPTSPESELADWWRTEFGRPPSRKKYGWYRNAWAHYSQMKHGATAIGNVAGILREEFDAVQQTVLAQSVVETAEDSARAVIRRLATHLDITPQDNAWEECVSNYRQHLTVYFAKLKKNSPVWLITLAASASPPLSWGDCIPGAEQRQTGGYRKSLNELPRLRELLQQGVVEWSARLHEIEEEHRKRQQQSLNKLTTEVEEWLSSVSLLESDQQSAWLALATTLSRARQDLEEKTFKNAGDAFRASYPGEEVSQDETAELLRLLDEYDRAVASIRLPFKEDDEVLRVGLDTSLLEASRVAESERGVPLAGRIKNELLSAVDEAERAAQEWDVLRQEVGIWSPPGKLVGGLKTILNAGRMAEVQSSLGVGSPEAAIDVLTNRERIISLLDTLSVQELIALERHVVRESPPSGRTPAATKQELYDAILVAVGLLPQQAGAGAVDAEPIAASNIKTLSDKVRRGLFDVFMAHNAQDKDEVLRLSRELRRKGIYPWVDVEQIPPGRWFQDVIQSAVRTVKAAAIVIGNSGLGRWQALELRVFMSRCVEQGIPLIPVLLPGVEAIPNNLEFLRELNQVKFGKDVTEEEGLSRLIWGITGEKV
jgi:nucleotide-binding universal stress UspA family protein